MIISVTNSMINSMINSMTNSKLWTKLMINSTNRCSTILYGENSHRGLVCFLGSHHGRDDLGRDREEQPLLRDQGFHAQQQLLSRTGWELLLGETKEFGGLILTGDLFEITDFQRIASCTVLFSTDFYLGGGCYILEACDQMTSSNRVASIIVFGEHL